MPFRSESSEQKVLSDISQALARLPDIDRTDVEDQYKKVRAQGTPRPVVDGHLIEHFVDKHKAVHGTVRVVKSHAEVPAAVTEFIELHNLPYYFVIGQTDFLNRFDWPMEWKVNSRPACKTDKLSVTDALCAIAESGTIVSTSSPGTSSTHFYLPENNVVIFDKDQIVRHLDDALKLSSSNIRIDSRAVHFITGPSKTADVEQTIQYGAHGPRRLHAIIIDTTNTFTD